MGDILNQVTRAAVTQPQESSKIEEVTKKAVEATQDIQAAAKPLEAALPVSDWEYERILPAIANASDPEDMKYRMATAIQYSRMMGKPIEETYANLDAYHQEWMGQTMIPKTAFKAVTDSWNIGINNLEIARLSRAWEAEGGDAGSLLVKQIDDYRNIIPKPHPRS